MYIGVSGIDGSGKTTVIEIIKNYISSNTECKTYVCDAMKPGYYNHELKAIEDLLVDHSSYDEFFSPEIVNLAYCGDLYENYNRIIMPKLDEGYTVVSHRSKLCCRVYSEVFSDNLSIVDLLLQTVPFPDLIFYLRTSPDIAMERVYSREKKQGVSICRKENIPTFEKANKLYDKLIQESSANIITINGDLGIEEIEKELKELLASHYK